MGQKVAIVFPASAVSGQSARIEDTRFAGVAAALRGAGLEVEAVPYADDAADAARARLLQSDGVLVWINPIQDGRDRTVLDALLEDVAAAGVFVSAHPDTIRRMGTKEVLYRTRSMAWGCDTRLYPTAAALREGLAQSLAAGAPRVLKQVRGHSGDGVWKVEAASAAGPGGRVRVRHAKRGSVEEEMPLDAFLQRCAPYFAGDGRMIDQAYQPRLTDGMVRCYLVGDRVEGFGEQKVNALYPADPDADPRDAPPPGPRLYYPPTRPDFQPLKERLEKQWVAEMCRTLALDPARLPVLWDADFLYGPKDAAGADSYVLCEINVSSVSPFPDEALAPLAAAMRARLKAGR